MRAPRRPLVNRGALAGVVILALALAPAATAPQIGEPAGPASADVTAVEGSGLLSKAVCMSCAAAIIGVAGGSVGGFVLMGSLYPELYGACAYQCYYAFS